MYNIHNTCFYCFVLSTDLKDNLLIRRTVTGNSGLLAVKCFGILFAVECIKIWALPFKVEKTVDLTSTLFGNVSCL